MRVQQLTPLQPQFLKVLQGTGQRHLLLRGPLHGMLRLQALRQLHKRRCRSGIQRLETAAAHLALEVAQQAPRVLVAVALDDGQLIRAVKIVVLGLESADLVERRQFIGVRLDIVRRHVGPD